MLEKKRKKVFSLEFKRDAAKLVLEQGYTYQQVIDSLGISMSAIGRWVRSERAHGQPQSPTSKPRLTLVEQEELKRLRKENKQLLMEREILKKAAVFFANEVK